MFWPSALLHPLQAYEIATASSPSTRIGTPSGRHDFHFSQFHGIADADTVMSLARHEHFLFMKLRLKPGMRVLELGCQSGDTVFELANFSGVTVVGVDPDPAKIARANRKLRSKHSHLVGQVSFICTGDYASLSSCFPPSWFDAIYSIEGLRFTDTPSATLFHILSHILKPRGRIAIYDWCWTPHLQRTNADHVRLAYILEALTNIGHRRIEDRTLEHTVAALADLAAISDFQVEEYGDLASSKDAQRHPMAITSNASRNTGPMNAPQRPLGSGGGSESASWYTPLEIVLADPRSTPDMYPLEGITREGLATLIYAGRNELFTPMAYVVVQKRSSI